MQRRHLAFALPGLCLALNARAQVQLGGVMGQKALLVINGQTEVVAVGASARGVRLVSLQGDTAQVEVSGQLSTLRVGGSPVALGGGISGSGAREIVIPAGPGGHFIVPGAINGQATTFMVDTGATTVALGLAEAQRLRLDLRRAERGMGSTANGVVPVLSLMLDIVRVGEVDVASVAAAVLPASMPHVLLGNSFLSRFQMRRDNDVMRLELRR